MGGIQNSETRGGQGKGVVNQAQKLLFLDYQSRAARQTPTGEARSLQYSTCQTAARVDKQKDATKANADQSGVFESRTVVDEPHAGVHLDSLGGRVVGGRKNRREDGRGRGRERKIDWRSGQSTVALSRNLLPDTIPPLPSCEESVSIHKERESIEHIPISLSVFVSAGLVVASFLKGEVSEGEGEEEGEGEGGWEREGEGALLCTASIAEGATLLAFRSLPQGK